MDIEYKEAGDKDVSLLLKLDQTAFCRDFDCPFKTEEEVKKYFANSKTFLILWNEKPIGYYSYKFKNKDSVKITGIVIVPQYQGKGIGSAVLKKILNELKTIKTLVLTVHPKNSAAVKLYYNFGFIITGWKDNYFSDGQPRLLMEKVNY